MRLESLNEPVLDDLLEEGFRDSLKKGALALGAAGALAAGVGAPQAADTAPSVGGENQIEITDTNRLEGQLIGRLAPQVKSLGGMSQKRTTAQSHLKTIANKVKTRKAAGQETPTDAIIRAMERIYDLDDKTKSLLVQYVNSL